MKTATEYMLQGIQIAMTSLLRPQSGSGILELIEAVKILKTQKKKFELFIAGSLDHQNKSSITKEQLMAWESLGYIKYLGQVKDMVDLYKKIPEFKEQNYLMTLQEFKFIFWWEYVEGILRRRVSFLFRDA